MSGQLHEALQAHPGFGSDERIAEALRHSFHETNDKFIANDPQSADPEHGGAAAGWKCPPPSVRAAPHAP